MRAKILAVTLVFLFATLTTAWGADISGKWKGSMDAMGQSMELGFTFKADGTKLTGTSTGPQGEEYQISDGKIEGEKLSFSVKTTGKMEMNIKYKGTFSGDEVKLTMEFDMSGMGGGMGGPPGGGGGPGGGMPPMELVLKRVK